MTKGLLFLAGWLMLGLASLRAEPLICSISVPSSRPQHNGDLPAELVLKNTGATGIRVCTLCMAWRGASKSTFDVRLTPDSWKSDAPTPDMSAQSVVTIEPGRTIRIPFTILTDVAGIAQSSKLHVTASYSVSKAFAEPLHLWSGSVTAEPVDVTLVRK